MTIRLHIGYKGGPGSGNWGHEGRPGKEGGSLPTGKTHGAYNPNQTANKPAGGLPTQAAAGSSIAMPRLSIPVGTLPEHQKGDTDGKAAYTEWYANAQTKPNLADALAMRRYFADRALEAEGVLAQQGAEKREESRKKRAEEEANKPEFLTPAQKKKRDAAAKKAATAAASAKKKAESDAAKKKKAEEAAAKKKAAGTAKQSADEKRAEAQQAKIKAAQAKLKAKVESQIKVAESVGMDDASFSAFRDAVATLKAGGTLDASIAGALAGAGLIKKSGDTYTVPSAAMTLLNAITASDAIKARAAMAKLGGTKEIGQVRMHRVTRYVIDNKGSSTSGNRGHAGRPGKVGGSAPKGSGVVSGTSMPEPVSATPSAKRALTSQQAQKAIDDALSNLKSEYRKKNPVMFGGPWEKNTYQEYSFGEYRTRTANGRYDWTDPNTDVTYQVHLYTPTIYRKLSAGSRLINSGKTKRMKILEVSATHPSGASSKVVLHSKTTIGETSKEDTALKQSDALITERVTSMFGIASPSWDH